MSRERTNLDRQLSSVRRRWIVRDGLLAGALTVLAIIPVCLVLGWLDWRFDFTRLTRTIEVVCLLTYLIWIVLRFILPPLSRRRGPYASACQVESVYDQFGGRIVSRIEFARSKQPAGISAELIDAMTRQVERETADFKLDNAIDFAPTRKPAAGAAVVLLILLIVVATRPTLAALWLQRTIAPLSDAPWPRRTHITVDEQPPVRRGDSVTITGNVAREIPRTGQVEWKSADNTARQRTGSAEFDIAADGKFAVTVGPLLQPITVSLYIGDAEVTDIGVDVVVPPELEQIEAVYNYPTFTNRQPDRVQSGDVRVLVGTRVDLKLTADRPAKRMELVFSDGQTERVEPVILDSDTAGHGSFVVEKRGQYEVLLFAPNKEYDFTTDSPARFVIDPVDNALPTVRLTRPGSEHTVTPATRLQLRFEAGDDYGVTEAVVRYRKRTAPDAEPGPYAHVPIPLDTPRREWTGQFGWELVRAGLEPGEELEYYVEVHDAGRHLTEDKIGVSRTHLLKVVTADALRQSLEARLRDAFGELDHLTTQQQAARDAVELAIVSLPTGDDPLMPADVRRVSDEQHRQTRMLRQVKRIGQNLADIADELAESYLADAERTQGLHELAAGLNELHTGPMSQAVANLEQAQLALRQLTRSDKEGER